MQDSPHPFEVVTIAASHAILQPVVTASLGPQSFEEVRPLRWVRSADAPIRQVFCFHQWKGGVLAPSWGLSLDFVPHVAGGRLKWHRTPKSAMLDLRVDSRERSLDIPYHHGPQPIAEHAPRVVSAAVAQAQALWDACRTRGRLVDAFLWTKQYYAAGGGLGFYNFVQHPLALSFVYASSGHLEQAYGELEEYGPDLEPEVKEDLRERLAALAAAA